MYDLGKELKLFDWINSTVEQCAWHIAKEPSSNTYSQLEYHKRRGKSDVVEKILAARKLAKSYRVILKAEKLKRKLEGEIQCL